MVPIQAPQTLLDSVPPHYAGRWRIVAVDEFGNKANVKKICNRVYGDVYVD